MQPDSPNVAAEPASPPRRAGWPKAHLIYYVLATLDIIAIATGLLLSHRIMGTLESVVQTSSRFEQELVSVRNLTDAITDAKAAADDAMRSDRNAIIRDAFETRVADARAEMDRIRGYAQERFSAQAQTRFNRILIRLDKALTSTRQHALAAFDKRAAGDIAGAEAELNQVQRRYLTMRPDIRDINQLSALQRNGNLEVYRQTIAQMRNYEFLIGGLIILIICSVVFYGHFISTLMHRKYRELEIAHADADEANGLLTGVNGEVLRLNTELARKLRELTDAQNEMLRKGKLAQLGQLTATVAHELRNPLGAVRTSTFLLERKVRGKALGIEPQLDRINNGVARCDNIISQLLDFARSKELSVEQVVFDEWLSALVQEEAQKLPSAVAIECELGLGDLRVGFDPVRMSRVVINLLSNASEAMVGKGDDPSRFTTRNPTITVSTTASPRGIEFCVKDNGPGVAPENLSRICEPLFTTKNFGTGLGLPAVAKILEQHGGGLDIQSTPGAGASFIAWIRTEERAVAA